MSIESIGNPQDTMIGSKLQNCQCAFSSWQSASSPLYTRHYPDQSFPALFFFVLIYLPCLCNQNLKQLCCSLLQICMDFRKSMRSSRNLFVLVRCGRKMSQKSFQLSWQAQYVANEWYKFSSQPMKCSRSSGCHTDIHCFAEHKSNLHCLQTPLSSHANVFLDDQNIFIKIFALRYVPW